jgi:hypothetical protein
MDSLKCNVWFFVLTRALHWHTWRASGAFTALLKTMCCWWLQNISVTKFCWKFFFIIKIMWIWGFFWWSIIILMFSFNYHLKFSNSHLEATRICCDFLYMEHLPGFSMFNIESICKVLHVICHFCEKNLWETLVLALKCEV